MILILFSGFEEILYTMSFVLLYQFLKIGRSFCSSRQSYIRYNRTYYTTKFKYWFFLYKNYFNIFKTKIFPCRYVILYLKIHFYRTCQYQYSAVPLSRMLVISYVTGDTRLYWVFTKNSCFLLVYSHRAAVIKLYNEQVGI